jgi:hypothetical protein
MKELTVTQLATLTGKTRQAVHNWIGLKKIDSKRVYIRPQVTVLLDDEDFEKLEKGETEDFVTRMSTPV